jgi:hypothetical protein
MSAWWPAAHIIGYEHTVIHQVYDLLKAIAEDTAATPNFYDGLATQRVLFAIEDSIKRRTWASVDRL